MGEKVDLYIIEATREMMNPFFVVKINRINVINGDILKPKRIVKKSLEDSAKEIIGLMLSEKPDKVIFEKVGFSLGVYEWFTKISKDHDINVDSFGTVSYTGGGTIKGSKIGRTNGACCLENGDIIFGGEIESNPITININIDSLGENTKKTANDIANSLKNISKELLKGGK